MLANSLEFIRAMVPTEMTLIATPIVLEPEYRGLANSVGSHHTDPVSAVASNTPTTVRPWHLPSAEDPSP